MTELLWLAQLNMRAVLVVVVDRICRDELELLVQVPHWYFLERSFSQIDMADATVDVRLRCNHLWVEGGLLDGCGMHRQVEDAVRAFMAWTTLPLPMLIVVPLPVAIARHRSLVAKISITLPIDALVAASDVVDSLTVGGVEIDVLIWQLNADGRPLTLSVRLMILSRKVLELLLNRFGDLLCLCLVNPLVLRRQIWHHLDVVRGDLQLLRSHSGDLLLQCFELRLEGSVGLKIAGLLHSNDAPLHLLHVSVHKSRNFSQRHHLLISVYLPDFFLAKTPLQVFQSLIKILLNLTAAL